MSKFNLIAEDPKRQKFIASWVKRKPPLIYVYAPTGEGKTYLAGDLISHCVGGERPYGPVLWIDADIGSETVGELADNSDLCTLWGYDGLHNGKQKLNWLFGKLEAAEKIKCGAIVIEGLTSIYSALLLPHIKALSKADGVELWGAHKEPAQQLNTAFEAISALKINRRFYECGVPVYVTLNVREVNKDPDNSSLGKHFIPDISPNRIRAAMRTSDAFLELQRTGNRTRLLCKRDPYNKFRKLRRASVADKVEATTNLSIPGLLAVWAIEAARAKKNLAKELAAEFAQLEAEDQAAHSEPEPEQEASP